VEVRIPHWASEKWVQQWLTDKQEWISKSWSEAHGNYSQFCLKIAPGAIFPYQGKDYFVRWCKGRSSRVVLQEKAINIEMSGRSGKPEEVQAEAILKRWYKNQAEELFSMRLTYWESITGLSANSLKIKTYKRRWGSCSASGVVTLNWKLVLLDTALLDYVIMHELAHLKHMNHSKEFWSLVTKFYPDWKQKRSLLNQRAIILEW
jgi:predicted metal-dependent hydrolase